MTRNWRWAGNTSRGAKLNYNGDVALSWQVLWLGPLWLDAHLGSPGEVSDQLLPMLARNRALWQGHATHFYAASGSRAGKYLNALEAEGFSYTVSSNKWTGPLERTAQALPACAWKQAGEAQHPFINHMPEGCDKAQRFAVIRRQEDLFARCGFIACDQKQTDAALTGERHRLKGGQAQLFSEVLSGMDLHHPPCSALRANEVYYLIAALAYNLMGRCGCWT